MNKRFMEVEMLCHVGISFCPSFFTVISQTAFIARLTIGLALIVVCVKNSRCDTAFYV
jgi:hypothetical protein